MILMRLIAAGVAAALFVPSTIAAPLEEFVYGRWSGKPYTDEETGAFSHCAVSAVFDDEIVVAFTLSPDEEAFLLFLHRDWPTPAVGLSAIELLVDGAVLGRYDVVGTSEQNALYAPITNREIAFDRLAKGRTLQVVVHARTAGNRETHEVSLVGSHTALSELTACVERGMASDPPPPAFPFRHTGASDTEQKEWLVEVLKIAGLPAPVFMSNATLEKEYPGNDVAWHVGGVGGIVGLLASGDAEDDPFEQWSQYFSEQLSEDCESASANTGKLIELGPYRLQEPTASCFRSGFELVVHMISVAEGDEMLVLSHTGVREFHSDELTAVPGIMSGLFRHISKHHND